MNIRLRDFLEKEKVWYEHEFHRTAYTAQEVAAEEHVPGKMVAKTVVIKSDDHFALAVLPASARTNFARLKAALGAKEVRLASELEFTGLFPDCEVGAMPPFGNLYGVPVYVDTSLTSDEEIVFNAGTHQDTVRMKYADFERLALPMVFPFALGRAA
jgi:Ala-tRNA(Pro) deacylase